MGQCFVASATLSTQARDAYDAIAPAYDVLVGNYAYDRWLRALEELAIDNGLQGVRLLDVACGTGESFLPLLARGYEVTACDISPGMLEIAKAKASHAELHLADMRDLPTLGSFDLVSCIDDPLNYLLEEDEFEAALRGIARNLAPRGIAVWDLNTVAQYRGQFSCDRITAGDGLFIGWRSTDANARVGPGDLVEVEIDVFAHADGDDWRRSSSIHRQRHWPRATVEELVARAGMRVLDVRGQHPGAVIGGELDEFIHTKAIYVAGADRKES